MILGRIKQLFHRHKWKWTHNTLRTSNPMINCYQSHYVCEKCGEIKIKI